MSIDFSKVTAITTPSGSLSKINRTSDSVELWPNNDPYYYIIKNGSLVNTELGIKYVSFWNNTEDNTYGYFPHYSLTSFTEDGTKYLGIHDYTWTPTTGLNDYRDLYIYIPYNTTTKPILQKLQTMVSLYYLGKSSTGNSWTQDFGWVITDAEYGQSFSSTTDIHRLATYISTKTVGGSTGTKVEKYVSGMSSISDTFYDGTAERTTKGVLIPVFTSPASKMNYTVGWSNLYFSYKS